MLFLERLERVTIRREHRRRLRGTSADSYSPRACRAATGDFACDLVTLDDASTYLVLSREVDPDAYRAAVEEAVNHHQLDRGTPNRLRRSRCLLRCRTRQQTRRPGAATPSCRWAGRHRHRSQGTSTRRSTPTCAAGTSMRLTR